MEAVAVISVAAAATSAAAVAISAVAATSAAVAISVVAAAAISESPRLARLSADHAREGAMSRHLGRLLMIAGVCWSLQLTCARAGDGHAVVDDAKLFLPSTLRQADAIADAINRDYHQRILVETFTRLPADKAAEYRGLTRHEQQHFFERWANERIRNSGVDLYVLICGDPARVRVVAARPEGDGPLSEGQRMEVRKVLEDAFEKKRYDDGLLRGLERADDLLLANSRVPQNRWAEAWPWVFGIGAALVTLWLLLRSQRLLRRKLEAMKPNSENDIGEPGIGVHLHSGELEPHAPSKVHQEQE
jgi:hypothetical protein